MIYLRVPWSFLEPKEGEFNWSLLRHARAAMGRQREADRDPRQLLRRAGMRNATPKWVQDAGAKGVEFEFGKGVKAGGPLWDPDYLDPVFLQKLEHFRRRAGATLRRQPQRGVHHRRLLRHVGRGAHGVQQPKLPEDQTLDCVKRHIDLT